MVWSAPAAAIKAVSNSERGAAVSGTAKTRHKSALSGQPIQMFRTVALLVDKSMIKGIAVGGLAIAVPVASGVTGYLALSVPAAHTVDQAIEPRLGDGHHLHPDGMRCRPDWIAVYGQRATGSKYLINPNKGLV